MLCFYYLVYIPHTHLGLIWLFEKHEVLSFTFLFFTIFIRITCTEDVWIIPAASVCIRIDSLSDFSTDSHIQWADSTVANRQGLVIACCERFFDLGLYYDRVLYCWFCYPYFSETIGVTFHTFQLSVWDWFVSSV